MTMLGLSRPWHAPQTYADPGQRAPVHVTGEVPVLLNSFAIGAAWC